MNEIFESFKKLKIIPVITIHDAADADPLADVLVEGGLPCAEITFRTAAAEDALRTLSHRSDILPGAGSILNIDQAQIAMDAGARFIVSPGFNPRVVQYCLDRQISVIPGTCTPTDFTLALESGLSVVKFFPAESLGGLETLKAMSAPFPMLKFIPTGGIGPANVQEYLKFSSVLACGGSWMVKQDLLQEKDFGQILKSVQQASALCR